MNKIKIFALIMILFSLYMAVDACTIGIASGSVTQNGKPLIWKTRDRASKPHNQVYYNTNFEHNFVSVVDSTETISWMGVNEQGFAILNSAAYDLMEERDNNHGVMMEYALGNFATLQEFENYLISTDGNRLAWGNFAVMDKTGEVAIFEASNSQFWRFDADESEAGWLIRTNFSVSGGGNVGLDRYLRSEEIISALVEENELSAENIFQHNLRDLSDENSEEIEIPFEGHSELEEMYGFFDTRNSISDLSSVSGVVIQGVLPDENPKLSVMYTALGNPQFTPAVPVFPVGQPSSYLYNSNGFADFNLKSLQYKEIFYSTHTPYLFDTFCLESESNSFLEDLLEIEENIFQETEELLAQLTSSDFTDSDLIDFQEETYAEVFDEYESMQINTDPDPDFTIISTIDFYTGIAVQFGNNTTHNPTQYEWDFNDDGLTDSFDVNPSWNFPGSGYYNIILKAIKDEIEYSTSKQVYIESNVSAEETLESQGYLEIQGMQNPFIRNSSSKQNYQISFSIKKETDLKIDIYNIKGEKIKRLTERHYIPGSYNVSWDLKDLTGKRNSSGIYLFSFATDYGTMFKRSVIYK